MIEYTNIRRLKLRDCSNQNQFRLFLLILYLVKDSKRWYRVTRISKAIETLLWRKQTSFSVWLVTREDILFIKFSSISIKHHNSIDVVCWINHFEKVKFFLYCSFVKNSKNTRIQPDNCILNFPYKSWNFKN